MILIALREVSKNSDMPDMAEKPRILIVEDEWIVAGDLRASLEHMGYAVAGVVDTGQGAIEHAAREMPDLVLMDIALKGEMDGMEATGRIRSGLGIPVVYLSGYPEKKVYESGGTPGPFGYITKPYEERELRLAVEATLYGHRMELALAESQRRFSALFENTADAVFVCDGDGNIVDANRLACETLGYSHKGLCSLSLMDINRRMRPEGLRELRRGVREQGSVTVKGAYRRRNGSEFPVELRLSPLDSGDRRFMLASARDLSERERIHAEREGLLSKLREVLDIVDTLRITIPLCVMGKKIRSSEDLETHIGKHHNALIKNGDCAECRDIVRDGLLNGDAYPFPGGRDGKGPGGSP